MRECEAPRAAAPEQRTVTCYRCAKHSDHTVYAESGSCPHCAGRLVFGDVLIDSGRWGASVQTTGSVWITGSADVRTNLIVCSGDLRIAGRVHAMCLCAGRATVDPTAEIRGGIRAASLDLAPGASIRGCLIETNSTVLGSIDIDAALRAAPGRGPAAQIEIKPTTTPIAPDESVAARLIRTKDGARPASPTTPTSRRAVS